MKLIFTTVLGISLSIPPLFAAPRFVSHRSNLPQEPQQPDKDKKKPQQPPPTPPPEPRPQPKPTDRKPQSDERNRQNPGQKQNPDTPKHSKENSKRQERSANPGNQQHPRGQRIPEQKFKTSFGPQHVFRPQHLQDNRRFQYGGYWFEVVEVWPAAWAFDDECYIEEDGDDYYLIDTFHPSFRLLIIVVE